MEWRLCTDYQTETQDCFNKHLLQKADGTGSQVPVNETGWFKTNVVLPSGVTCSHCVIQWNYRGGKWTVMKTNRRVNLKLIRLRTLHGIVYFNCTGNNWGDCGNGTGAVG